MNDITEVFCQVDDVCVIVDEWLAQQPRLEVSARRGPTARMSASEILTIIIMFQSSHYRDFKAYYCKHICEHRCAEFPKLLSYTRFVASMPRVLLYAWALLLSMRGECSGISFVDSTRLQVCRVQRATQNKVFADSAKLGKTSMGWFFGFKLHLVINDMGELLAFDLTPGNCDDRSPMDSLMRGMFGKVYGDKGYLSKALRERLYERGVELFTPVRKNMKQQLLEVWDKLMLRKRVVIESVIDQLKNVAQVEHSRHRSPLHFFIHLLAALISSSFQPSKPSLNIRNDELGLPLIAF